MFILRYKNARMCRKSQKSIAGRYKRKKHKRINIKLLLFCFIWLGSRESGTLGDQINLTFMSLAKGKVIKPSNTLKLPHHSKADSRPCNMVWHRWDGDPGLRLHDTNDSYGEITKSIHNKKMYTQHGNRAFSLMHINKGPSDFEKKMTMILKESKKIKPHIINISEANVRNKKINDPLDELKDYKMEHPKTSG